LKLNYKNLLSSQDPENNGALTDILKESNGLGMAHALHRVSIDLDNFITCSEFFNFILVLIKDHD